jgi:DNA N-6-adenine-methyltransferase (Dam)
MIRVRCRYCGERFEAQRQSAKFCCSAHRVSAHWHRHHKPNAKTNANGYFQSGDDEWMTPPPILALARSVLGGIDLDPASNAPAQERVRATEFYTIEDDGLSRPWHGTVFLNPPYSRQNIGPFVTKLIGEYDAGRVTAAVLMTQLSTDAGWFHAAERTCTAFCFPRRRIHCDKPDGGKPRALRPSAFFYYGDRVAAFRAHFATLGPVYETQGGAR